MDVFSNLTARRTWRGCAYKKITVSLILKDIKQSS